MITNKIAYTDLNIQTTIDNISFQVLNIVYERFNRPMPKHSHGNNSYELHYIPSGHGIVTNDGKTNDAEPGTLYMTGPHVEHEQMPSKDDPMEEYCIYFKLSKAISKTSAPETAASIFAKTHFWYGKDSQNLLEIIKQIFFELENKYTGYMIQVEALLQQCIVKIVRNYETHRVSDSHFTHTNLVDSKYLIVEESFLYDYESITLESLADRLGLGIRQTERFIKEYYGKTFTQKKTEARMSMAKIFLNDKDISISEIAKRLNYSSVEHFAYAFKKYYGISARDYRKQELH